MLSRFILAAVLLLAGVTFSSASYYYLSLGVFPSSEAEVMHQQLARKGYPVYLLYGDRYEVRLGGYETREEAEAAAERLKAEEKLLGRVAEEEAFDPGQFSWEETGDPGRTVEQEATHAYRDPQAQKIISLALDLFGHPYKYGGTRIGKGIDCSFFVQSIFRELGIGLPRTSGEQFRVGTEADARDLRVGDLLFFKKTYYSKKKKGGRRRGVTRINHVGIYIGNGEFIHATTNVKRVTISRLDEPYFTKRFAGARRVLNP